MDPPAVGGDVFKEMCNRNSRGEDTGKARQQATGDGLGRAPGQKGEKSPPSVAKYNVHGYD